MLVEKWEFYNSLPLFIVISYLPFFTHSFFTVFSQFLHTRTQSHILAMYASIAVVTVSRCLSCNGEPDDQVGLSCVSSVL